MKLLTLTYIFLLALSSMPTMANEVPTCVWLHLDPDTRVYQCAVLAPEVAPQIDLVAESLPDPTQPIAQQTAVQNDSMASSDSMANIIPGFIREPIAHAEPNPFPMIGPVTVPIKSPVIDPTKVTTIDPIADTMVAESVVDSFSPVLKIAVVANGEIESVKALMQASGDAHFYVLPTSGRLSLGVYSTTAFAKRRQAVMLVIGIESELMILGAGKLSNVTSQIKRHIETDEPLVLESSSKASLKNESQNSSRRNNAVSGYLVATVGNQKDIIAELKRINMTDYVALTADPYRDRVSLGVYSVYENALGRQKYFKQLGIDSDLISMNESTVVRSTLPTSLPIEQEIKADDVPYGYNQIALQPLEI